MGDHADDALFSGLDESWGFSRGMRYGPVRARRKTNAEIFRAHIPVDPAPPTCACGQGKVSRWDGVCGHCRTKEQRRRLDAMFRGEIPRQTVAPPIDYSEF